MRNPRNPYRLAQSCYECHTVPDEELVNIGGHPAGSLDFELVSWSQGMVHHNFSSGDNQVNQPSSPERLRVLFAAGIIADLEFSLRATAAATKKETYAVTVAQRASRSGARLKSAAEKTQHPLLQKASELFATVTLKLNHAEQLTLVADQIGAIGIELGNSESGANLRALDSFIPAKERWK
jgi:hypothetical protein